MFLTYFGIQFRVGIIFHCFLDENIPYHSLKILSFLLSLSAFFHLFLFVLIHFHFLYFFVSFFSLLLPLFFILLLISTFILRNFCMLDVWNPRNAELTIRVVSFFNCSFVLKSLECVTFDFMLVLTFNTCCFLVF